MKFLIKDIKLPLDFSEDRAVSYLKNTYFPTADVSVYKQSVDARNREEIVFVYTFLVSGGKIPAKLKKKAVPYHKKPNTTVYGEKTLAHRPVVIGAGPAGLLCAHTLAANGYRPLVVERGEPIEERVKTVDGFFFGGRLNPESNVQFGEGGAGAFSDGKLTTRTNDPLSQEVVGLLARHSGLSNLCYQAKPHIGTDRLRECVKNIRKEILSLGGEFLFSQKVTDFSEKNGHLCTITLNEETEIPASVAVLATGHSAKDIYRLLHRKGIPLSPKAFSVGARVEHFQSLIDNIQYGAFAGHPNLGAADYQVFHHCQNHHTAYSFCMCPGGVVVPSQSEEGTVVTNGMSYLARDGKNANSALCVSVSPADFGTGLFDGLSFLEKLEQHAFRLGGSNQKAPFTTSFDLTGITPHSPYPEPSYQRGVTPVDFKELFPPFVLDALQEGLFAFERKMKGFLSAGAVFTGVETRTSSPLRINRNEFLQSPCLAGLYPCGEGAGYAGGIVSAGVDGMKIAHAIMAEYQPLESANPTGKELPL